MKKSWMAFKLQSGHKYIPEITIQNVHRATTLKVGKLEFCMTSHGALCLQKFNEIILNCFQVMDGETIMGGGRHKNYNNAIPTIAYI